MNTRTSKMNKGFLGGSLAILSVWALSACIIGPSLGGDSLVISAPDSASFSFRIDSMHVADSASINVADIRNSLQNKGGISDSSIVITDLNVTLLDSSDDSTKAFIAANAGKKFVLKIYYQGLLALATDSANALEFDSTFVTYELNKNIFGVLAGYNGLTTAIRDTTVSEVHVSATIDFASAPVPGTLKAKLIMTAQGQLKP